MNQPAKPAKTRAAASSIASEHQVFDRKRARALPDDELARELLLGVIRKLIDPKVLNPVASALPVLPIFNATGPVHDHNEREIMRLADILRGLKEADFVADDNPTSLAYEKALRLAARGESSRAAALFRKWLTSMPVPSSVFEPLVEQARAAARRGERLAYDGASVVANRRERLRAMAVQVANEQIERIKSGGQRRQLPTKWEFLERVHRDLIKRVPGFVNERGKPIRTVSAMQVWLYDTEPLREIDRLRRLYRD